MLGELAGLFGTHSSGAYKKGPVLSNRAFIVVADRTGLEPATSGVTGRHSNQLNYRSAYPASLDKTCLAGEREVVGGTGVEPVTYGL